MFLSRKSTCVAAAIAAGLSGMKAVQAPRVAADELVATAKVAAGKVAAGKVAAGKAVASEVAAKPQSPIETPFASAQVVGFTVISETQIPFDPPIVLRGWRGQNGRMLRGPLRAGDSGLTRDLLFHNEDRLSFKAMHPFLLTPPQVLAVEHAPNLKLKPNAPRREQDE